MSYDYERIDAHFDGFKGARITDDGDLIVSLCCPRCEHAQDVHVSAESAENDFEPQRHCSNELICGTECVRFTFRFDEGDPLLERMMRRDAGPVDIADVQAFCVHKGISDQNLHTHLDYHCQVCGEVERQPLDTIDRLGPAVKLTCQHAKNEGAVPFVCSLKTCQLVTVR